MDNLQASRICGGNTAYKRNKSDFYPTPKEATQALLDFLGFDKDKDFIIWEPACGDNDIVNVIKTYGIECIGTDIKDGVDFLSAKKEDYKEFDWIITNPPWSLAEEFIRKSASMGVPFAMLLKQHFWNAKKRYKLFEDCTPKYILPLTWRPDFCFKERGSGSPLLDVMWCVWDSSKTDIGETIFFPLNKPVVIK